MSTEATGTGRDALAAELCRKVHSTRWEFATIARACDECAGVANEVAESDWLAAVLSEAERKAAEKALREAARELPGFDGIRTHGDAAAWLRARADRHATGGQP